MGIRSSVRNVLVLLSCLIAVKEAAKSACLNLNEVDPPQYYTYRGQIKPITLGVSKRLTHRLTTEIFKIFLNEVLGYKQVEMKFLKNEDTDSILYQMGSPHPTLIPEVLINLETIVSVEENISPKIAQYLVKECGDIGLPIRYAWHTPNTSKPPATNTSMPPHYFTFQNSTEAAIYSLLEEDIDELNKKKKIEDYFIPEWCINETYCATLIASDAKSTKFVIDDINKMRLYVKVYWLENNFRSVTTDLLLKYPLVDKNEQKKTFLILGNILEMIAFNSSFTTVKFLSCNYYDQNETCNYVSRRAVKLASNVLAYSMEQIFMGLTEMRFTPEDYKEMVKYYIVNEQASDNNTYFNSACQWMKNHNHRANLVSRNNTTWRSWIHTPDNNLHLLGIFPYSDNSNEATAISQVVHFAVTQVNKLNILGNYQVQLKLNDGGCRADKAMRSFISHVRTTDFLKVIGILGPTCSQAVEALAGVVRHFDTVVISYGAQGSSFSDRKKYPNFFRTIGDNGQYKYVYRDLLKRMNWKRVASLGEDGTKYTEYVSQSQDLLLKDGVSFVASKKFGTKWGEDPEQIKEYLLEFKSKEARIIIADVEFNDSKALMCEAFHMNMTAKNGFVWFLPSWLAGSWSQSNLTYSHPLGSNCTTLQLMEALDAHFSLAHSFFANDNATIYTNDTVLEWKQHAMKFANLTSLPDYSGYAYDAVWVYVLALKNLMMENETFIDTLHTSAVTKKFIRYIEKVNFPGVTGKIDFATSLTRNDTKVNIYQWDAFSHGDHRVVVAIYDPLAPKNERLIQVGKMRWLTEGGKIPWDGTKEDTCIVGGLAKLINAECQTALIVANIIVFGFVLLLVLAGFLFIKRRYDKRAKLAEKNRIIFGSNGSLIQMNSLDKWEIQRDRVVINRKLGEGAFGMVYGGETYFNKKGWMAVAVKTLKMGSTVAQKLDFLSEADVMKEFDHKNIVQLLGVCTANEPVYTIMEFMLYGDLKTFLLARRHLANDVKREDHDDVSSKRLTSMALDVARALNYLARLKYVHRDVASRNCLVNASRVVKLGDFGMARPMCDHDYYKFSRKGLLPVRWMAPESLGLGVNTPASDVWSYGVLLYEIITFGNFPFQGMANSEVLDYVKAGNTLSVPSGVKPNLEGLIKSCWSIEAANRPTASQIVDFLSNNPRIIIPCLDVPLSSVPPMGDNAYGMPILEGSEREFPFTVPHRTPTTPFSGNNPWDDGELPLLPTANGWHITSDSIIEDD